MLLLPGFGAPWVSSPGHHDQPDSCLWRQWNIRSVTSVIALLPDLAGETRLTPPDRPIRKKGASDLEDSSVLGSSARLRWKRPRKCLTEPASWFGRKSPTYYDFREVLPSRTRPTKHRRWTYVTIRTDANGSNEQTSEMEPAALAILASVATSLESLMQVSRSFRGRLRTSLPNQPRIGHLHQRAGRSIGMMGGDEPAWIVSTTSKPCLR